MSIMVLNEIEVVPGDEDEEEDDHEDGVSEEAKEDDGERDNGIVEAEVA